MDPYTEFSPTLTTFNSSATLNGYTVIVNSLDMYYVGTVAVVMETTLTVCLPVYFIRGELTKNCA
jgi:hypothetical protein